jgi:hypothetical protein
VKQPIPNPATMLLVVRQPACSNVLLVHSQGDAVRLYQHAHSACKWFAVGWAAAKGLPVRHADAGRGDILSMSISKLVADSEPGSEAA